MKRMSTIHKYALISLFVLILAAILFVSCSRLLRKGDSKWGVANFEGVPRSGRAPLEVEFTDKSSVYTRGWDWKFPGGSPEGSKEKGPHTVKYDKQGNYDVSLEILYYVETDTIPRSDTETKVDYITVTAE